MKPSGVGRPSFSRRAPHLTAMPQLHMTRAAVGCPDYPALASRIASRAERGEVRFPTRFRPKRADELIGGKLHFIVRHTLVARDRKSVVWGKGVSVRVGLGGRRLIKKKKQKQ